MPYTCVFHVNVQDIAGGWDFQVGQSVEVNYYEDGNWISGKITERISFKKLLVKFQGYEDQDPEPIDHDLVRAPKLLGNSQEERYELEHLSFSEDSKIEIDLEVH